MNVNIINLFANLDTYVKLLILRLIFDSYLLFLAPKIETNPCQPSPCGPNSICREINKQAVCTCISGYIGAPPLCRPECTSSSDCRLDQACINQKCADPCPGSCGYNANCQVINHNPLCSCNVGFTGDPFSRCIPIRKSLMTVCNFNIQYYSYF